MNRNNIQVIIITFMLAIIAWLFFHQESHNLNCHRLAYQVEHAMDIVQELKELSQNIAVKDALDNFTQDGVPKDEGCFEQRSDLFSVGTILEVKSKQIFDTLHQVLCELKKEK